MLFILVFFNSCKSNRQLTNCVNAESSRLNTEMYGFDKDYNYFRLVSDLELYYIKNGYIKNSSKEEYVKFIKTLKFKKDIYKNNLEESENKYTFYETINDFTFETICSTCPTKLIKNKSDINIKFKNAFDEIILNGYPNTDSLIKICDLLDFNYQNDRLLICTLIYFNIKSLNNNRLKNNGNN